MKDINDYINHDSKHSALLVFDVQHDFTLIGAAAEIPIGTAGCTVYPASNSEV